MPTYEYECQKCGIIFEKFQKMSEEPVKKCPDCDGDVNKIPSLCGGIIFKGKGFYSTDNKSSRAAAGSPTPKRDSSCPAKDSCPAADKSSDKGSCCCA